MTVASTDSRITFAGNDVTTSFATSPVVFFDTEDLVVYVTDDDAGTSTLLVEDTDYTVTGGDGSTGTVSLAGGSSPWGALATDTTLVIEREVAATQDVDLVNNDGSDAEVMEDALDRLTMLAQQHSTKIGRTLRQPTGDPDDIDELPSVVDRASKYLSFDTSGDPQATDPESASGTSVTITGGTTAILLANRFDTRPEDLGAVGDGVTDDITAINAALALSKYVRFTPGKTYLIGSHMIPQSGQWVDARGATIKLKAAANANMFRIPTGVNDVTVYGGDWDGNKANQTTGANGFTSATGGTVLRVRLKDLTVHDCYDHGIGWNATTTKYVIEEGVIAYNNGASGVGSVAGVQYATVTGNIAYSNGTSNFGGAGIHNHVAYVGNIGFDAGTADNFTGYDTATDHVVVVGNISSGGDNHGIHFGGSFITVVGNAVDAPVHAGIHMLPSAGTTTGMVVVGNTIDAPQDSGVDTESNTNFVVAANTVVSPTDHGYLLDTSNTNGVVVGNVSRSAGVDGFRTDGTCAQLTFVGNAAIASGGDGFQLDDTTESVVVGNNAKDNATPFNESGTSNTNFVASNDFNGNTSTTPTVIGAATQWRENAAGGTNTLASATTITLPRYSDYIYVTGTTTITGVTASWARRVVTIVFDGILTFTDGNNLKLAGDFVTSGLDSITLECDGTDWYEIARSAN